MKRQVKKGSTDVTLIVFVQDAREVDGSGLTGLAYNASGLTCYYVRPGSAAAPLALATQTVTGDHADGGFVEIDSTNMPGFYRLDLSDALVASGVDSVCLMLHGADNMVPVLIELDLVAYDPNDPTPDVNVAEIDNQSAAAVNLRKMLDGTGGVHVKLSQLTISASVPGGSGAVEITNTLGPAIRAVSINGHAVLLNCMAGDYAGLMVSGSGAGSGIMAGGGATGNGMRIDGGSTSGHGVEIVAGPGGSDIAADLAGTVSGVEEAGRQALADEVLKRNVSNVEASAAEHSLCTIVLATLESAIGDTTWTIKRTDGNTTHATKTVTVNPEADPISGVS
jgi:hypothetical protein